MEKKDLLDKLAEKENYREQLKAELIAVGGQIVMLREMIKNAEEKEIKDLKKTKK